MSVSRGAEVGDRPTGAHNHQGLYEAMCSYDVAASALVPFHMFEAKLVCAAIEAGAPYANICDE